MHTLTLSKVEANCVERHLILAHDGMMTANPDRVCIEVVLARLKAYGTTIILARLEVFCVLRALRSRRAILRTDMEALEERRMRGGHNGHLDAAWRALDADAMCIDDVRRRLWDMI